MAIYDGIKARLLITGVTMDADAQAAYTEALNHVVEAIQRYDSTFVAAMVIDQSELWAICSDLGAGIFKRRMMPEDMDTGWWANGLKKLETYINTTYLPIQLGQLHFSGLDDSPIVSYVQPVSGPIAGGTIVGIWGANFKNGCSVTLGGIAMTSVTYHSSGYIDAKTPAGVVGLKHMVVTNPSLDIGTLLNAFTYV
jgi:hypothetical protein